jgi:hypothetical protein
MSDTNQANDPADEPMYEQLGDDGNPFSKGDNANALVEGNRVATAEDMESSEGTSVPDPAEVADDADAPEKGGSPGYEGEAPNAPLADWGMRDGSDADEVEQPE